MNFTVESPSEEFPYSKIGLINEGPARYNIPSFTGKRRIISNFRNGPSFSFSKQKEKGNVNEYIIPELEKNYYCKESPGVGTYDPNINVINSSTRKISIPKGKRFIGVYTKAISSFMIDPSCSTTNNQKNVKGYKFPQCKRFNKNINISSTPSSEPYEIMNISSKSKLNHVAGAISSFGSSQRTNVKVGIANTPGPGTYDNNILNVSKKFKFPISIRIDTESMKNAKKFEFLDFHDYKSRQFSFPKAPRSYKYFNEVIRNQFFNKEFV